MKLKLNVHSYIDVITNSSTEIYVQVGQNTIDFIETLINGILKVSNSKLTCKDLFIFDITEEENEWSDYAESYLTVTPKDGTDENVKALAEHITKNLSDIFEIDASYNG